LGNRQTVDDGLNGVYRKYCGEGSALGANDVNEYLDVSVGPDSGNQTSQGFQYSGIGNPCSFTGRPSDTWYAYTLWRLEIAGKQQRQSWAALA